MGQIQDVNPRVWVEWRRESVVIATSDNSDNEAGSDCCEIEYKDLQALISALTSSVTDKDGRFLQWEIARGER